MKQITENLKNATTNKNITPRPTYRLSNYEQNILLPILMKGLKRKRGAENAITNRQIVLALRKHGLKINERCVRKVVNHIRTNDLVVGLMASDAGFYIAQSEQEFIRYENRLLSREEALRQVRMSIERQRRAMLSHRSQEQVLLF